MLIKFATSTSEIVLAKWNHGLSVEGYVHSAVSLRRETANGYVFAEPVLYHDWIIATALIETESSRRPIAVIVDARKQGRLVTWTVKTS